jgi:hypothetical protein
MKCECGNEMKIDKIEILPGLFSEGYRCKKCGEIEFDEEQMRKALKIKEKAIKIMVKRRLGKVGESLVLRIPKSVEDYMNLRSGKDVKIIVENKKMIIESD